MLAFLKSTLSHQLILCIYFKLDAYLIEHFLPTTHPLLIPHQVMLGLQQPHDVFPGMGSPQKLDGSPLHPHQDLGIYQQQQQQTMDSQNGLKRKGDDVVLLQSQSLSSTDMGGGGGGGVSQPAQKKNEKKKTDNNGVKKKKTR